jgi:hypothetical protein
MYVYKLYADSPWAVLPCRQVQGYQYFGECTGLVISIEVETTGSSKMLVPIYLTTFQKTRLVIKKFSMAVNTLKFSSFGDIKSRTDND